jgi:hypothetical protein
VGQKRALFPFAVHFSILQLRCTICALQFAWRKMALITLEPARIILIRLVKGV